MRDKKRRCDGRDDGQSMVQLCMRSRAGGMGIVDAVPVVVIYFEILFL